jgi:lipopolysaccharide transport system ATP-binding protein
MPLNDILLSVDHVSKRFCRSLRRSIGYGLLDIVQEVSGVRQESRSLRTGEFWALKDLSFSLKRGDSLGIVGPNGSGKTTLLRIISGLIKPDAGTVTVRGRVAPLLALGAGFSPVLTGRENAYVNMTILGLSPKQIHERFSEVVEFAEIGDALDAPVQTYSSGMVARLGFACAVMRS